MSCGFSQYPKGVQEVCFDDCTNLDAFGRLRVSTPSTLFDSQQEYGLDTLRVWDIAANGTYGSMSSNGSVTSGSSLVGPTDTDTRLTPITCGSTNGNSAILQSRQYTRYIPGKGHLVFMTGIFAPASGSSMAIVRRTSTGGTVSDSATVEQSAWNIDKFDGTGPSGITLDFTKTQILVIQAQWLGVGRVIVGFDVDGLLYPAHQFLNANNLAVPYTQTFNLPVRMDIQQVVGDVIARSGYFDSANGIYLKATKTQSGGTVNFCCASVQSEGGSELRGFPLTANMGVTATGVTTRRAVLSIRPKATFNSRTNRGHIELADFIVTAKTNNALYEIVIGGTLGGSPSWTSVGTNSIVEYDVAGTTVTGGTTLISGYVLSGSGVVLGISEGIIDIRNPLTLRQIDALSANQDSISIVCTSVSGTADILASINWHEQTV